MKVGDHVHPVDEPDVDLVVDVVAPQGAAPSWLVAHDLSGDVRYVSAEETERHGRHELQDRRWPLERGATIRGQLPDVPPWPYVRRLRPRDPAAAS